MPLKNVVAFHLLVELHSGQQSTVVVVLNECEENYMLFNMLYSPKKADMFS